MYLKRVRFVMEGFILAIILQGVFAPVGFATLEVLPSAAVPPRRILFDSNTAIVSFSLAIDSDA